MSPLAATAAAARYRQIRKNLAAAKNHEEFTNIIFKASDKDIFKIMKDHDTVRPSKSSTWQDWDDHELIKRWEHGDMNYKDIVKRSHVSNAIAERIHTAYQNVYSDCIPPETLFIQETVRHVMKLHEKHGVILNPSNSMLWNFSTRGGLHLYMKYPKSKKPRVVNGEVALGPPFAVAATEVPEPSMSSARNDLEQAKYFNSEIVVIESDDEIDEDGLQWDFMTKTVVNTREPSEFIPSIHFSTGSAASRKREHSTTTEPDQDSLPTPVSRNSSEIKSIFESTSPTVVKRAKPETPILIEEEDDSSLTTFSSPSDNDENLVETLERKRHEKIAKAKVNGSKGTYKDELAGFSSSQKNFLGTPANPSIYSQNQHMRLNSTPIHSTKSNAVVRRDESGSSSSVEASRAKDMTQMTSANIASQRTIPHWKKDFISNAIDLSHFPKNELGKRMSPKSPLNSKKRSNSTINFNEEMHREIWQECKSSKRAKQNRGIANENNSYALLVQVEKTVMAPENKYISGPITKSMDASNTDRPGLASQSDTPVFSLATFSDTAQLVSRQRSKLATLDHPASSTPQAISTTTLSSQKTAPAASVDVGDTRVWKSEDPTFVIKEEIENAETLVDVDMDDNFSNTLEIGVFGIANAVDEERLNERELDRFLNEDFTAHGLPVVESTLLETGDSVIFSDSKIYNALTNYQKLDLSSSLILNSDLPKPPLTEAVIGPKAGILDGKRSIELEEHEGCDMWELPSQEETAISEEELGISFNTPAFLDEHDPRGSKSTAVMTIPEVPTNILPVINEKDAALPESRESCDKIELDGEDYRNIANANVGGGELMVPGIDQHIVTEGPITESYVDINHESDAEDSARPVAEEKATVEKLEERVIAEAKAIFEEEVNLGEANQETHGSFNVNEGSDIAGNDVIDIDIGIEEDDVAPLSDEHFTNILSAHTAAITFDQFLATNDIRVNKTGEEETHESLQLNSNDALENDIDIEKDEMVPLSDQQLTSILSLSPKHDTPKQFFIENEPKENETNEKGTYELFPRSRDAEVAGDDEMNTGIDIKNDMGPLSNQQLTDILSMSPKLGIHDQNFTQNEFKMIETKEETYGPSAEEVTEMVLEGTTFVPFANRKAQDGSEVDAPDEQITHILPVIPASSTQETIPMDPNSEATPNISINVGSRDDDMEAGTGFQFNEILHATFADQKIHKDTLTDLLDEQVNELPPFSLSANIKESFSTKNEEKAEVLPPAPSANVASLNDTMMTELAEKISELPSGVSEFNPEDFVLIKDILILPDAREKVNEDMFIENNIQLAQYQDTVDRSSYADEYNEEENKVAVEISREDNNFPTSPTERANTILSVKNSGQILDYEEPRAPDASSASEKILVDDTEEVTQELGDWRASS